MKKKIKLKNCILVYFFSTKCGKRLPDKEIMTSDLILTMDINHSLLCIGYEVTNSYNTYDISAFLYKEK